MCQVKAEMLQIQGQKTVFKTQLIDASTTAEISQVFTLALT